VGGGKTFYGENVFFVQNALVMNARHGERIHLTQRPGGRPGIGLVAYDGDSDTEEQCNPSSTSVPPVSVSVPYCPAPFPSLFALVLSGIGYLIETPPE
jgi:hypothetical protein